MGSEAARFFCRFFLFSTDDFEEALDGLGGLGGNLASILSGGEGDFDDLI